VGATLIVLALAGWIAFSGFNGGAVEAADPPRVTTAAPSSASASPSAAPTASATVAPSLTASPTPSRTTRAPVVTPPRTPGPNERRVPDALGRWQIEADYMIRSAGLVPDFTYVTGPDTCSVTALSPAANSIVMVGSTVTITVTRSSDDCQTL
jgi:hypothetical protein